MRISNAYIYIQTVYMSANIIKNIATTIKPSLMHYREMLVLNMLALAVIQLVLATLAEHFTIYVTASYDDS